MKLLLAPLQGLTDHTYRKVFQEYFTGIDVAYTPYFSMNRGNPIKKSKIKKRLDNEDSVFEIIPQILTNDAEAFILFSQAVKELGVQCVNLNMGCPYPIVTKKGKGVAMMQQVDNTKRFFEEIMAKAILPVSVKLRLGFMQDTEIDNIIPILNDYPIKEIILHPRCGTQYYTGNVDLEAFEKVCNNTRHELIYNGDILTIEDFHRIKNQFPTLKKIMIGRGILRNPYLFSEIKGETTTPPHKKQTILDFSLHLAQELSQHRSKGKYFPQGIKEHWKYLSQSFDHPQAIFDQIKICNSFEEYERVIEGIRESLEE